MNRKSGAPESGRAAVWSRWLGALVALAFVLAALAPNARSQPADPQTTGQDLIEIKVVGGGVRDYIPLAVPDTINLGDTDPKGAREQIPDLLRRNLGMSGFFRVLGPESYFFDPRTDGITETTINFQNWYNVGARAVVKTGFRVATNQVRLDFRLFDVASGKQIPLEWEPTTVGLDDVPKETYRFINAIIKYYTGEPGVFGSRIAYVSKGRNGLKQVFTAYMDGTGIGAVTNNGSINILPSWGPGGVMYTSWVNGNPDVFLGPNNGKVLSARPGLNTAGSKSPDGGEIAATLSKDGNAEIYILDRGGSILRRCTDNDAIDTSPSFSPDGSQIAFVSDRAGSPQIYIMNRDCSNQRRITFRGSYNQTPDWSPKGDWIAFTGRDRNNRFDIFLVDPVSTEIVRLTQNQGNNEKPSFSPDGRHLVFASTRGGGGSRLFISTVDGEHQMEIPGIGAGAESPAWER